MNSNLHSERLAQRHPRIAGAILLLIALAIAKWQIYNPLHAAEYGYTELHVWPKLIGGAILLGAYGIVLCIFGDRLNASMPKDFQNISWQFAVVAAGLAFLGLAVYIFVMTRLTDQGYATSFF